MKDTTHFGYQQIPVEDKAKRVAGVFDTVAARYDIMNDLMSLGLHRVWKWVAVRMAAARAGHRVLDLAAGTGDLAARLAALTGESGRVVLADINANMLRLGRDRLINRGLVGQVEYVQADAERLPFADNDFNIVTIAFGLRNVTDKDAALREMQRVLKPGGRALVLEFSKPAPPLLATLYDRYSFTVLPAMGKWVTGDADSYRYLAESIRMHPDQDALRDMMAQAGFERCDYTNMTGGIVAVHRGYKF